MFQRNQFLIGFALIVIAVIFITLAATDVVTNLGGKAAIYVLGTPMVLCGLTLCGISVLGIESSYPYN